jgi:hypothetical protein
VSIVTAFGWHQGSYTTTQPFSGETGAGHPRRLSGMAGARLSARGHVIPFAEAFIGVEHVSVAYTGRVFSVSRYYYFSGIEGTRLFGQAGGGVDVPIGPGGAVRITGGFANAMGDDIGFDPPLPPSRWIRRLTVGLVMGIRRR